MKSCDKLNGVRSLQGVLRGRNVRSSDGQDLHGALRPPNTGTGKLRCGQRGGHTVSQGFGVWYRRRLTPYLDHLNCWKIAGKAMLGIPQAGTANRRTHSLWSQNTLRATSPWPLTGNNEHRGTEVTARKTGVWSLGPPTILRSCAT